MEHIFEEIEKLQGEREVDLRVKKVLTGLAEILNNIMINLFPVESEDTCCGVEASLRDESQLSAVESATANQVVLSPETVELLTDEESVSDKDLELETLEGEDDYVRRNLSEDNVKSDS